MPRPLPAGGLLGAAVLALPGAAATPQALPTVWPAEIVNPHPAADDLVLPLPCGGSMAFRPVGTPADRSPLADRPVRLGTTDPATGYNDYLLDTHILGSLPAADGARLFYLGKYEVTREQWAAVTGDGCPDLKAAEGLPQGGVSWFGAVDYSRRLTEWLLANAPDRLPSVGDTKAYLRLPTETEWEYAARGGDKVDEAAFRERLFPMPKGGLGEYAWYQGADSANNEAQPVGLKEPNPLGLYDVLGNVEELVLTPFHLNRVGREHGEVGGFVTRGGSFKDPAARLRTAMRYEYAFFDPRRDRATVLDTIGFRLALAAPVTTSSGEAAKLRDEWQAARDSRVAPDNDPLRALAALRDGTTDAEQRARLDAVEAGIQDERRRRDEIEDRAAQAALLNGALLVRALREDTKVVAVLRGLDAAGQQRNAATIEERQRRLELNKRGYTRTLIQVADDVRPARQAAARDVLAKELGEQGLASLVPYVDRFHQGLDYYAQHPDAGEAGLVEVALRP